MQFKVSPELISAGMSLLVVDCKVADNQNCCSLSNSLNIFTKTIQSCFSLEQVLETNEVKQFRAVLKDFGWNPNRYRISSEALLRRIFKGYNINIPNELVNLNNCLSLFTLLPVGSYDQRNLSGKIKLRLGKSGESFYSISKGALTISNCIVLADEKGVVGSPINDSKRCMLRADTKDYFLVIYGIGNLKLEEIFEEISNLGKKIGVSINGWNYFGP